MLGHSSSGRRRRRWTSILKVASISTFLLFLGSFALSSLNFVLGFAVGSTRCGHEIRSHITCHAVASDEGMPTSEGCGRRASMIGAGLATTLQATEAAHAAKQKLARRSNEAPQTDAAVEPKITARCEFTVRFGKERVSKMRKLVIGLFGDEAPILTRNFMQACTGTYPGDAGDKAYYKLADVKTIVKDKVIIWAKFKDGNQNAVTVQTDDTRWVGNKVIMKPLAGNDTFTDEVNGLRHNLAGRVSMKKGGGTFDFNVAPVADASWLDETDVVIGQVIEGMDIIADINEVKMYGSKPLTQVRFMNSQEV